MSPDHAPPGSPAPPDLAAYEARQAKLYEALAEYQSEARRSPNPFGLALFHRILYVDHTPHIEAVLAHAGGAEITSGLVSLEDVNPTEVQAAQRLTASLLLGDLDLAAASQPQQPQTPLPLQQDIPVDSAGPERRTDNLAQDTPTEAEDAADAKAAADAYEQHLKSGEPTVPHDQLVQELGLADPEPSAGGRASEEEIAAIIARCDALNSRKPAPGEPEDKNRKALRLITTTFRTHFGIAKNVPFAKALATVDRMAIDWVKAELAKEGA